MSLHRKNLFGNNGASDITDLESKVDQDVSTTASPTFGGLTLNGPMCTNFAIDTCTATTLEIGPTVQNTVTLSRSGVDTSVQGTISVEEKATLKGDTEMQGNLNLDNASSVDIKIDRGAKATDYANIKFRTAGTDGFTVGNDINTDDLNIYNNLTATETLKFDATTDETYFAENINFANAGGGLVWDAGTNQYLAEVSAGNIALQADSTLTLDSGTTITLNKPTLVNDIDTITATTLLLGKSTATKVEIADTGVDTEVQGDLDVIGDLSGASLTIDEIKLDSGGLTFSTTNGNAKVTIPDNQSIALRLREGATDYITIDTTNGTEHVNFYKKVTINHNLYTIPAQNSDTTLTVAGVGGVHSYLTILSDETGLGGLQFGDDNDENAGSVIYDHSTDTMDLNTNGLNRVKINATNVDITVPIICDDIDSRTATTLLLGKSTATKVEIADTGIETEIQGNLACSSTTAVFLPPRLTTAQRDAISSPVAGSMVYDTDLDKLFVHDGTLWLVSGELTRMTNRSGGTLVEGDVVKVEVSASRSVEKNTSTTIIATIGVVYEGGADTEEVSIAYNGVWNVRVLGTTSENEVVKASSTAGQADRGTTGGTGVFGITLEANATAGVKLVQCILSPSERF